MKTLTSHRHPKNNQKDHKNANRCTNSVSTCLPQLQQDPGYLKALGMHWADQKTSVKTYFICGHNFFFSTQWLSLPTEKKKVLKKERKKMKSKVFISKPYWFFFIYKTRPCLSIKNRMSKGLNLCPAKNPNFLLTSRQASQNKSRRGQERARKSNLTSRSSKHCFLILSSPSTKFLSWTITREVSKGFMRNAMCEWKQETQQTSEYLFCRRGCTGSGRINDSQNCLWRLMAHPSPAAALYPNHLNCNLQPNCKCDVDPQHLQIIASIFTLS